MYDNYLGDERIRKAISGRHLIHYRKNLSHWHFPTKYFNGERSYFAPKTARELQKFKNGIRKGFRPWVVYPPEI